MDMFDIGRMEHIGGYVGLNEETETTECDGFVREMVDMNWINAFFMRESGWKKEYFTTT